MPFGGDVPDQQLLAAAPLVADQQPGVPAQRGERRGVQAAALAGPVLADKTSLTDIGIIVGAALASAAPCAA